MWGLRFFFFYKTELVSGAEDSSQELESELMTHAVLFFPPFVQLDHERHVGCSVAGPEGQKQTRIGHALVLEQFKVNSSLRWCHVKSEEDTACGPVQGSCSCCFPRKRGPEPQ